MRERETERERDHVKNKNAEMEKWGYSENKQNAKIPFAKEKNNKH